MVVHEEKKKREIGRTSWKLTLSLIIKNIHKNVIENK
jgi:hypothetical protein